ncbi:MAG TPA: hypothetical protein VGO55_11330 [Allosphingosinicella sp.]|nr:hypothetical protein [Allosphingosinicella sp.]
MKFSARARVVLAVFLLLTLGVKLLWTRDAPAPDGALFVATAEATLRGQGFRTGRIVKRFGTIVRGERGACRLTVGDYTPDGTLAEPLEAESRSVGALRFVWAGEASARAPKLRPLVEFYLKRELGRLGFHPARRPILAVAANPACAGIAVDWTPLATLPR